MVDMKKVGKPTFVSLILYPVVITIAGIVIVINGLITFCGFIIWSIFHPKQALDKVLKMTHSWLGRW